MISTILKEISFIEVEIIPCIPIVEVMMFVIEPALYFDIDELEKLYDDLNDYLSATTNYPGWIKALSVRENAVGIEDNSIFVVRHCGKIAGSVILDHHPMKPMIM